MKHIRPLFKMQVLLILQYMREGDERRECGVVKWSTAMLQYQQTLTEGKLASIELRSCIWVVPLSIRRSNKHFFYCVGFSFFPVHQDTRRFISSQAKNTCHCITQFLFSLLQQPKSGIGHLSSVVSTSHKITHTPARSSRVFIVYI